MREIYLDNSATTRVCDSAARAMMEAMTAAYGNPSSLHKKGMEAENLIKEAKDILADALKCSPSELIFTSCGTEADNLAIIGTALAKKRKGMHILTTQVEHPAVSASFDFLESLGFTCERVAVDGFGRVKVEDVLSRVRPDTVLVSVMAVNNEVGAVMPIEEIGKALKEKDPEILFHVDAVQAFGKYRLFPAKMKIDLLAVSGHKIHGPKGIGVLYVRDKVNLLPTIYGGGQQKGRRSGTENVPGIVGLGRACAEIYTDFDKKHEKLLSLKKRLMEGLSGLSDVRLNSLPGEEGAPHVISASFSGIRAEVLLHALEEEGIYVSSGSACSSHKPSPSKTLTAMGLPKEAISSTIRFSLSDQNTIEEIEIVLETLQRLLPFLRRFSAK